MHRQKTVASSGRKIIAVLYFKNLTQDPSLNWLNGGLTEMLTTNLGQVGGMEVLSTEQISLIRKRLKYKPDQELTSDAAPEIAREAGTDAYVTGALIRIGPARLRADVHLQESATGKILFSDKVESSDINGIFAMVDTMTTHVVGGLLPRSQRPEEVPQIEQVATSNFEAYRHYQACLDNQNKFSPTEAIRECQEAVRLDPQFALAYLRLVILESRWGSMDEGIAILAQLEPLQSRLPRIRQLQMQAWKSILAADYEGAIQQFEAMLHEAPRDVETRLRLAAMLQAWEPERAVAILREGLALDPKEPGFWNNLTYNESEAGNQAAALEACDRFEALVGPNEPNVWSTRGDVFFFFGRYEEAAAAYLKARKLKPDFSGLGFALATIYSEQGKTALANQELRRGEQEIKGVDYMLRAQMLQDRGEPEAALLPIRRLIEEDVKNGRIKDAREDLLYFARYAKNLGEIDSALAFVRQQKIHGKELEMVSLLEAAGREEDGRRALQQFVAANPETPPLVVERARVFSVVLAAIWHGDGAAALRALEGHPGQYMYDRGRAQLLVHDYAAAEYYFRRQIFINLSLTRMPLVEHLAHFHLGDL